MSNTKQHASRFSAYLYSMLVVVALLGLAFAMLLREQLRYQEAIAARELSLQLTEELRQSSTDLARLVRSYVITGNARYRDYFFEVLAIRDGHRPRPTNYNLAYWELKIIEEKPAPEDKHGTAIGLIELMRQAGFTQEELTRLIAAKTNSDRLVEIEKRAIQLVSNHPNIQSNRDLALSILADRHFNALKAQVVGPIMDAQKQVIARTQQAVETANQRLTLSMLFLLAMAATLVVLIILLGRQIRLLLGCSVQELQATISRLGRGDFLTPIRASDSDSVLGWIARTQHQLASLNPMHFKAIVESSEDAIISKTAGSIVASWNAGAERMFGYSASEMIGSSIRRIIPESRVLEEDEILEKISRGEKVEHFETQRLHRDGHLIDVSASISPIYSENGSIIGASKIVRDITRSKANEAEIQRLAFYDTLTGLANRRLLIDRLTQNINRYPRDHAPFAVLFLDLDNFKTLNDSQGHLAGDALLEEVARRLLATLRKSDTAARLGGDEFVLLINLPQNPTPDNDWLTKVVDKVRCAIAAPYLINGTQHTCTTSIGVTIYHGQACTALELLRQADNAMYQAKHMGKNQFHLFEGDIH